MTASRPFRHPNARERFAGRSDVPLLSRTLPPRPAHVVVIHLVMDVTDRMPDVRMASAETRRVGKVCARHEYRDV